MAVLSLPRNPRVRLADAGAPARPATRRPARCPRCRGPLYRDFDGDHCCLFCGEYSYLQPVVPLAVVRVMVERPRRGRPSKRAAVA